MSKSGDTLQGLAILNLLPAAGAAVAAGAVVSVGIPLLGAAALLYSIGTRAQSEEQGPRRSAPTPIEPPPLPPLDLTVDGYPFLPKSYLEPNFDIDDDEYERQWRSVTRQFLKEPRNVRIRRYFMAEFRAALTLTLDLAYSDRTPDTYMSPEQHIHRARGILVRREILP